MNSRNEQDNPNTTTHICRLENGELRYYDAAHENNRWTNPKFALIGKGKIDCVYGAKQKSTRTLYFWVLNERTLLAP